MCIQTPGSFIWALSLASREGTKWSSWITYVVTGVLQGCLLVMCVMFELRERRAKAKRVEINISGAAGALNSTPRYRSIDTANGEERGSGESSDEGEERPLLGRGGGRRG